MIIKLTRRLLALLLAFSMCASMVTPAYASETEEEPVVVETTENVEERIDGLVEEVVDEETDKEESVPVVEEQLASEDAAQESVSTTISFEEFELVEGESDTYTATLTAEAGKECTFIITDLCEGAMVLRVDQMPETLGKGEDSYQFTFDNREAAFDQDVSVKIILPYGIELNPGELRTGIRELENLRYNWFGTWTAPAYGTLTITILSSCENWFYVVNNLTSGVAGTEHYSTDGDAAVWSESITVNKDDEIQLVVGTADGQTGNITFDVAFEEPLGTPGNPVKTGWTEFEQYAPGKYSCTITVDANTETYFCLCYFNDYVLLIDGENKGLICEDHYGFSLRNDTDEAQEYVLTIREPEGAETEPLGSELNPYVLKNVGTYQATNVDKKCHYTYTVEEDGTLAFSFDEAVCEITITNGDEVWTSADNASGGMIKVDVQTEDELIIAIFSETVSSLEWSFGYVPGSSLNNAYELELEENEEEGEYTASLPLAADASVIAKAEAAGMVMNIPETVSVEIYNFVTEEFTPYKGEILPDGYDGTYFRITNNGEAGVMELKFAYPDGSERNPEKISEPGSFTTTLDEGINAYYYVYTPADSGYLSFYLTDVPDGVWADIFVNGGNLDEVSLDEDGIVNVNKYLLVPVEADIPITVQVCRWAEEGDPYPEAQIGWEAVDPDSMPGATPWSAIKIEIEDFAKSVRITVPAKSTVYYQVNGGVVLEEIEDVTISRIVFQDEQAGGYTSVDYQPGSVLPMYDQICLAVTNENEYDVGAYMSFYHPIGSKDYPAAVNKLGEQKVTQVEGDIYGYHTVYTAEEDGTLVFSSIGEEACAITVTLPNGQKLSLADYSEEGVMPVPVRKGDKIAINTMRFGAGDYTWYVNYTAGEKLNPADFVWEKVSEVQYTETVTVPAKSVYYYVLPQDLLALADMEFTITGSKTTLVSAQGEDGVVRTIVNSGKKDKTYELKLVYTLGSSKNLDHMALGKETAKIYKGNENGYLFTWTAPSDGILSFAMTAKSGWNYVIKHNDEVYEGTDAVGEQNKNIKNRAIHVSEGEELLIIVGKNPDKKTGTVLAGNITFTTNFTPFEYTVASGKALSLSYVHPETGVAYAASKVNWEIDQVDVENPDGDYVEFEDYSAYATIKKGKLNTFKCGDSVTVWVRGRLGDDTNSEVCYKIQVLPASNIMSIWDVWYDSDDEVHYDVVKGDWIWGVTGAEQSDEQFWELQAFSYPENSAQKVIWKSSKTSVVTIDEDGVMRLVWNAKKNCYNTGTATITATAADGSGKKASFKMTVDMLPRWMTLERVDAEPFVQGEYLGTRDEFNPETNRYETVEKYERILYIEPGETIKLKVDVDPAASKKYKSAGWYWDDNPMLSMKILKDNQLSIKASDYAADGTESYVYGYVPYGGEEEIKVVVKSPITKRLAIAYLDVPGDEPEPIEDTYFFDLYSTDAIHLRAVLFSSDGEYEIVDAGWTTSNKKIAKPEEYWNADWDEPNVMYNVTGKAGSFHATASYIDEEGILYTATAYFIMEDFNSGVTSLEITAPAKNMITIDDMPAVIMSAGQSVQFGAKINSNAKNKKVVWDWEFASYEDWNTTIGEIKISSSGKLTADANIQKLTVIYVTCYPLGFSDLGFVEIPVIIQPRATNVHMRMMNEDVPFYVSNTTKEWDLNNGNQLELSSLVYPFDANQNVNWTVSGKGVATIQDHEDGKATLNLLKPGKVTITATAQDGSKEKASFTLNVIAGIDEINYKYEKPQITFANKTLKLESFIELRTAIPNVKPTAKNLYWHIESIVDIENGEDVQNPASVVTLDQKTGVMKVNKHIDRAYGVVIAVQDYAGDRAASAEVPILVVPKAMTGVVLKDANGNVIKKGSTIVVNDEDVNFVPFTIEPKNLNDKTFYTYYGWENAFIGTIDKDYIAQFGYNEDVTSVGVVHVGGAGKVKVTIKTTDGSNKSSYFYVNFKHEYVGAT